MISGIIGKKLGMTQIFTDDGRVTPVTVIEAGPCAVVQKKTVPSDGYDAVQIGFLEIRESKANKPMTGHFKKAGTASYRHLREFHGDTSDMEPGSKVTVEIFARGDKVSVMGTSRGKGFQGVIVRHHFKGGRATHGSMFHREPGGIGSSAWPSRVWKNKRLPGHMGNGSVTTRGLEVVDIKAQDNILLVKGAVPGSPGGIVIVNKI